MKALSIFTIIYILIACANPSKERVASDLNNESIILLNNYPDCFSDIDTTSLEQGLGCGNIFLYQETKQGIITVIIDPEKIRLSNQCRSYSLTDGIEINLEIYPAESSNDASRIIDFCKCVKIANTLKRIPVKADFSKIKMASLFKEGEVQNPERITVQLNDLRFKSPITNTDINFEEIIFWDVSVGWFPG
jgi:hypothetical protein